MYDWEEEGGGGGEGRKGKEGERRGERRWEKGREEKGEEIKMREMRVGIEWVYVRVHHQGSKCNCSNNGETSVEEGTLISYTSQLSVSRQRQNLMLVTHRLGN